MAIANCTSSSSTAFRLLSSVSALVKNVSRRTLFAGGFFVDLVVVVVVFFDLLARVGFGNTTAGLVFFLGKKSN